MIDKIFVLNHKDFVDRKDYITKKLQEEGIEFEIVDHFHPNEINYEELMEGWEKFNPILIQHTAGSYWNFSKKINVGSLSLVLKHIWCWKKQVENNYEYCLILEDDCEIPFSFQEKLNSIMMEVKDVKCGLVMVGTAFDFISPTISENKKNIYFHRLQKTRCTHAYIIQKDCANIMINGFSNFNLPIDFKMNEIIQLESIEVYWYEPGLKQKDFT